MIKINKRPKVTKCICFDRSFEEIKQISKEENTLDLDKLIEKAEFGQGCQMCLHYVKKMLLTGQTEFDIDYPR